MTPTTPLSRLPASPPLFAETPTAVRKPARATDTATLSVEDILKAFAFGAIAAVIGAVVWDKLVYYTHIQFGLVAVGVGFVVGLGVAMGAGGKTSVALQAMGALLALAGMLLGEGLIIKDVHQVDLMTGIINIPSLLAADPLTLLFIAIGVYEGWKIPGRGKTAG